MKIAPSASEPTRDETECRLLKDGKEVWHKTFPFPLCFARVLEDGTIAGCGYTQGVEDAGDLVITVIDPKGAIRVKEAYHRRMGKYVISGQQPDPQVGVIVADPENDVVIFVMSYNSFQFFEPDETAWRTFQLSTGKPLGVYYPQPQLRNAKRLGGCHEIRPLPGTPLLLAQWYHCEQKGQFSLENPPVYGAHFALLDKQCSPVWQMTLPGDYDLPENRAGEKRLSDWIHENSAILSVRAPGQFDLYFAKEGLRVSFAASQDEKGKWAATETGRKPYTPPGLTEGNSGGEKEVGSERVKENQ